MVVRAYGNVLMFVLQYQGKWETELSAVPEDGDGEIGG